MSGMRLSVSETDQAMTVSQGGFRENPGCVALGPFLPLYRRSGGVVQAQGVDLEGFEDRI